MLFVHGHGGWRSCLKFPSRERCYCSPYYRSASNSSLNAIKLATFTTKETPFQPLNVDTAMNSTVYWITNKWSCYVYRFMTYLQAVYLFIIWTHSLHSLSQLAPLKPPAQSHVQVLLSRVPPFRHTRLQAIIQSKKKGSFECFFVLYTHQCNAFAEHIIIIDFKFAVDKVHL